MKKLETITIIIPLYNESSGIDALWQRLTPILDAAEHDYRVLFVDDGSTDDSFERVQALAQIHDHVRALRLTRNFGKEAAMTAGLDHADGDAVIIMDADLQDPPELIPQMVARAEDGWDVVIPRRTARHGESKLKIGFSNAFYWLMGHIESSIRFTPGTGDYRLMTRRVVDSIRELRESHRMMKGLFDWVGYPRSYIDYERDPRAAGQSKFNFFKLLNLALDGITAFSITPLKLATYLGVVTSLAAFAFAIIVIIKTLLYGDPVAGYPTLITVILLSSGIQLLCLGILGEYLGRIFGETKARPLYLVQDECGVDAEGAD